MPPQRVTAQHIPYTIEIDTAVANDMYAVSLDRIRDNLRIDHTEHDAVIERNLSAATDFLQRTLGRQFLNATLKQHTDAPPLSSADAIQIRVFPVSSISEVTYIDTDGTSQTWASSKYQTDLISQPARLSPAINVVWPTVQAFAMNAFTIKFVAGHGDGEEDVPDSIKHALTLLTTHWYRNPEIVGQKSQLPFSLMTLIDNLRWDLP